MNVEIESDLDLRNNDEITEHNGKNGISHSVYKLARVLNSN